jgi:hypothetical protein
LDEQRAEVHVFFHADKMGLNWLANLIQGDLLSLKK